MAREYRFLTTWCVQAPADAVFDALEDCAAWPQWWPGVRRAELLQEGDAHGTGRLWHYVWRSRLPYDLAFDTRIVRLERPWLMEGRAEGELVGVGRWRLFEAPGATAVLYEWQVRTTRRWMNRVAPVARPAFAWNHDAVMRQGGEGLARRLGATLLAQS